MTKPRLSREIIKLYDEYTHAPLDRRVFLSRLAVLAGGTAAASALLPVLENNYARAQTIPEDDPQLATEQVMFEGSSGGVSAYVAKPADAEGPLPAIVVVHENRGLNPHIEDVARRAALGGYVAIAVDFLSPSGGTPADEDDAREMIGALDDDTTLGNGLAALAYAREGRDDVNGRVGVVGFCWGGGLVNRLAVADPEFDAAVSYYGPAPDPGAVPDITASLLLHYAGLDDFVNPGIDPYVEALDAAGVDYEMHMYEGVDHAFHNDTNEARYDEEAATLSWERTMAFFDETLKM